MEDKNHDIRMNLEKMRGEMDKIAKYSIDIANDPGTAIKKISDPLMHMMDEKVKDFTD